MVARYNGPGNGPDTAAGVAVSPDGRRVFVTGSSYGGLATGEDFATVAYGAAIGRAIWEARYDGPDHNVDQAVALEVAPDRSLVFVTGSSFGGPGTTTDIATVAYRSGTGQEAWAMRYDGPAHETDAPSSVAVSPDGATVYATGASIGSGTSLDFVTIAYRAATGEELWVARYDGPASGSDEAASIGLSPDGGLVFVTGYSASAAGPADYATVAYRASSGGQLWVARQDGPDGGDDVARDLAVSPDGSRVYVTGYSFRLGQSDFATVVYRAATGTRLGVAGFDSGGSDTAASLVVSPDGGRLYVTGSTGSISTGAPRGRHWGPTPPSRDGGNLAANAGDFATVAYDTGSGARAWVALYDGPAGGFDDATEVALRPDGSVVVVTGSSTGRGTGLDYATVAYDASGGARLGLARYDGPAGAFDAPNGLSVGPTRDVVYVTGGSDGGPTSTDYATVAYGIGVPPG